MTPQQKAIELLTKYRRHLPVNTVTDLEAKVCALIAVEEIINIWEYSDTQEKWWWQQVKHEIEKNYDPARKSN
jgi:hypothetical protein